jgi:hypothetical protein
LKRHEARLLLDQAAKGKTVPTRLIRRALVATGDLGGESLAQRRRRDDARFTPRLRPTE